MLKDSSKLVLIMSVMILLFIFLSGHIFYANLGAILPSYKNYFLFLIIEHQ